MSQFHRGHIVVAINTLGPYPCLDSLPQAAKEVKEMKKPHKGPSSSAKAIARTLIRVSVAIVFLFDLL